MTNNNYFQTDNGKVLIIASCPEFKGIVQPMQLFIVIEDENDKGKYQVYNFKKEQCEELMEQMKHAVGLVNCFG